MGAWAIDVSLRHCPQWDSTFSQHGSVNPQIFSSALRHLEQTTAWPSPTLLSASNRRKGDPMSTRSAHRRNKDGSYDSICPSCSETIARSKPQAELAECDKAHVCHSSFLAERGHLSQTGAGLAASLAA